MSGATRTRDRAVRGLDPPKRAGDGALRSLLALLLCCAGAGPAAAQDAAAAQAFGRGAESMPRGDVFRPLIADPKQPQFLASAIHSTGTPLGATLAAVAFGENLGFVRWNAREPGDGIQLGLAGGVFAQFDLGTPSFDLVNADYTIGVVATARRGAWSGRARFYHQSSHLGDEYLLRVQPERVNLSFEALEALASLDMERWRAYAGGEVLVRRDPGDLVPTMVHAGLEFRGAKPVLRFRGMGAARFVAGVDAKSWQRTDHSLAWSVRTGLEFRPDREPEEGGRRLSLLLELYDGASPYGQFYAENISYVGIGVHFTL